MLKKQLSMKDLIAKKGEPREVMYAVPDKLRSKIKAELLIVIEAKRAGLAVPGHRTLSVFISEKYNYHCAASTVGAWLKRLEEENPNVIVKTKHP